MSSSGNKVIACSLATKEYPVVSRENDYLSCFLLETRLKQTRRKVC